MSKPDWKDAPEWAQWLAQDRDGEWFWYEREPAIGGGIWWPVAWTKSGRAFASKDAGNWRNSLEPRPTTNTTEKG